RTEPQPAFIQSVYSNLFHDLDRARAEGFRLVIIDTPPAVTRAISEVVSFADLVVAPTRPSPHDMRAVGPTIDIADAHGKPLVFVINAATPQARITSEAAIALSQHGTVSPAVIHNRVDYAASMIDGRTVMEIDPFCKSAQEVSDLWEYLRDRLNRGEGGYRPREEGPQFEPSHTRAFGRRAAS
ncbi:MAG: ParA family protein, partial [Pseudomonadota bacterium]